MYQAYRTIEPHGCFGDKQWLPFTGETIESCRQSAATGGLSDFYMVYIAEIDSALDGIQPVPANAKFMGKL